MMPTVLPPPSRAPRPRRTPSRARRIAGFSMLDALVAFFVASVGIYGLMVTQARLARNADVAKQRTEATRLAQEQIETLRGFTSLTAKAGQVAWTDLASSSDTVTTNAAYTRTWTLAGSTDDALRRLTLNVSWVDRSGEAQTVSMTTVISKTDPANVGALGFPLPANTTLKRPKNRNLNIPVPAKDLGGGKSVYQLASNFAVVFSNDSGYVVQKCSKVINTAADLDSDCESYDAYILAGYVSRTMNSFPAGLGISTAGLSGLDGSRTVQCSFGDATNQNSGAAIDGYKYYLCILPVVAEAQWSGTVRLTGMSTGTNYRVCRFQQPAAAGVSANMRNVQPYADVGESLDNQNYVITTANSCPTISGLATTLHQLCTGTGADRVAACPAS